MERLINALITDFIQPSLRRLGSTVGSALTTYGVAQGQADQVETFIPIAGGILLDLLLSKRARV